MTSPDKNSSVGTSGHGRWQYVFPLRYGWMLLAVVAIVLMTYAMTGNRSDAVRIAFVTLGAIFVVLIAILPRMTGNLEMTGSGLKAELMDIGKVDPDHFVASGPATLAAEEHLEAEYREPQTGGPRKRPRATLQEILKNAQEQGWVVTQRNHRWLLTSSDGEKTLTVPITPKDLSYQVLRVAKQLGIEVDDRPVSDDPTAEARSADGSRDSATPD